MTLLSEIAGRRLRLPAPLTRRVEVVRARAEDHRTTYEAVVSRALAPLPRLLGWCLPLTARDGTVLAIKGRTAEEEITASGPELDRLGVEADVVRVRAHEGAEPATVVRARRLRSSRPR